MIQFLNMVKYLYFQDELLFFFFLFFFLSIYKSSWHDSKETFIPPSYPEEHRWERVTCTCMNWKTVTAPLTVVTSISRVVIYGMLL